MNRKLIFALDFVMGAVSTLAYTPFAAIPCFWIGYLYLLWRIQQAETLRGAALRGWFYGQGLLWAAFYWIVHTMESFGEIPLPIGILGTAIYVGFYALQYVLMAVLLWKNFFRWNEKPLLWLLTNTVLMTAVDCLYPKHFTWESSLLFVPYPFWAQTLDVWGTYGLSFILFWSLGTVWLLVKWYRRANALPITGIAVTCAMFLLLVLYGMQGKNRWLLHGEEDAKRIKIAGIQANIGSADKIQSSRHHVADKMQEVMLRYLTASQSVGPSTVDLVVWPETAYPDYISTSPRFRDQVAGLSMDMKTDFLIGGFDYVQAGNRGKVYNGIFLFNHQTGALADFYYKHVLLAFGEYVPFSSRWPKLKQLFPAVSDFSASDGPRVLPWREYQIGVSICYEAILVDFMYKLAQLKPDFLVNITNDSWFGDTREPYFHLYLQVMRAIEHRLPLFRLSNTGISAWVSPYGEVHQATPVQQEALLMAEMPVRQSTPTVFGRFGYLLSLLTLWVASFVCCFFLVVPRRGTRV